jgi:hypothetical protein
MHKDLKEQGQQVNDGLGNRLEHADHGRHENHGARKHDSGQAASHLSENFCFAGTWVHICVAFETGKPLQSYPLYYFYGFHSLIYPH